jgi:RNA polymerase sigma factor (sigma-70 family)
MAVDDIEFREFFAAQYERLCWLGLVAYARKVLVSRRRSLLRRAGVESRFLARTRVETVPSPGDEEAMVLWQAVQGLPPRQRAVLVLRFHEDLTETEVARLLGLPLGTVKSLAHRGLARRRDRLGAPDLDPTTTRRETQ